MALKAVFLPGQTAITVNGLHQWDRGQQLDIHADDLLGGVIEVHFACVGMETAIVRSCSVTGGGVCTVGIPDQCLEQSAPIMAWVYEINGAAGTTTRTIVLNVTERARPTSSTEDIPTAVVDKYTEAITAMNEVVADTDAKLANAANIVRANVISGLTSGSIAAAEAGHALKADQATEATMLSTGGWVSVAQNAAAHDGTYLGSPSLTTGGLYIFRFMDNYIGVSGTLLLAVANAAESHSTTARITVTETQEDTNNADAVVWLEYCAGALQVHAIDAASNAPIRFDFDLTVDYKQIA